MSFSFESVFLPKLHLHTRNTVKHLSKEGFWDNTQRCPLLGNTKCPRREGYLCGGSIIGGFTVDKNELILQRTIGIGYGSFKLGRRLYLQDSLEMRQSRETVR